MRRTLFVMALCSVLAAGCGGSSRYLQRGVERYERTDYRGALKQWNELNGSEGSMNDQVLTRYLVYRGLTHYHLGQRSLALIFLTRGKEVYAQVSPTTLRASMVEEMNKALADVSQLITPKSDADAAKKDEPASAPPAETAAPVTPPPAATGEALVPTKAPAKGSAKTPPAKTAAASAGPAPAKTASPAAGKPAAPAPAKAASPAPAKAPPPPTRTSPAVQSTSPK